LLGRFELADDPLDCVPGAFHGQVPGPVWPAEDSHSPCLISGVHVTAYSQHLFAVGGVRLQST
jgi:hypothetical protein